VVEVDRERGRIGLRLADDPEIAGKTVEELASLTTANGDSGPGRRDRPDRPSRDRAPRDRDRDRSSRGGERVRDSDPDRA
jgi:polyribonucleotide nucleotidyltransferase